MEEPDESDSESETEKGFMAASQVKEETINRLDKAVSKPFILTERLLTRSQYLKKKKAELAALGEWTHIDCLRPNARDDVHDDILRKLIYEADKPAEKAKAPASQPKSRLEALLSKIDEVDLMVDGTGSHKLSVHDVPGGTVSFLFEKSSKSVIEEASVDEMDS